MAARFSDAEIAAMLAEPKILPSGFWAKTEPRSKRGHSESECAASGSTGRDYRLILRQNDRNPLDFSLIIGHLPSGSSLLFRLRRYNGKHQHSNIIESTRFDDFHVHRATERYQLLGMKEDSYAEPSSSYSDINGALRCAIADCAFEIASPGQRHIMEMLSC